MKTTYSFIVLLAVVFGFSCTDKYMEELTVNAPVYLGYEELRSAVGRVSARPLVRPGKIYFKGNHLLIVEYMEGVHVIDVSNPSNPQNAGFIEIPGCVDIAVKEQSLYADSFVDLVTIDISDISNPKETKRLKHVLPYTVPSPENPEYPYAEVKQEKGVVVGWEVKREKREIKTSYDNIYPRVEYDNNTWSNSFYANAEKANGGGSSSGGASFGISGSMARFGLYENYLYIAGNNRLYMFDTETASQPVSAGFQPLNGTVETMFIYDGHLFFGTPSGMLVYALRLPLYPEYVGNFWHTTSCDPVVVQGRYAYITLRAGTECGGGVNRLDIVEMSDDYKEYHLVSSYSMTGPYGLGIDENKLFICDGSAGLKIYDATDKGAVSSHLLASFPDIRAYDVIPAEGFLFMIGDDGFYLYDYSDHTNIHQIGYIPVE
ncbi:MAG: hypothetical protein LBB84_11385 [Tannerellaceae bacterium]|jgi:hypothetical protein|nr:hypothetical protein [Tannerellaceae bacterium]